MAAAILTAACLTPRLTLAEETSAPPAQITASTNSAALTESATSTPPTEFSAPSEAVAPAESVASADSAPPSDSAPPAESAAPPVDTTTTAQSAAPTNATVSVEPTTVEPPPLAAGEPSTITEPPTATTNAPAPATSATATPAATLPTLRGAEALLTSVREQLATNTPPTVAPIPTSLTNWMTQFKTYQDAGTNLPPFEAAAQWLSLIDAYWKLPPADLLQQPPPPAGQTRPSVSFATLLATLPRPHAWSHLREMLDARTPPAGPDTRHETSLQTLCHTLMNDASGLTCDADAFAALLRTLPAADSEHLSHPIRTLRHYALRLENRGDKKSCLGSLEATLQAWEHFGPEPQPLALPDIAELVGEDEARALIDRALEKPNLQLHVPAGGRTLAIAQEVALTKLNSLTLPQWGLVCSPADVALYEALAARFPTPDLNPEAKLTAPFAPNQHVRSTNVSPAEQDAARQAYLVGLIINDRVSEAVKQLLALPPDRISPYALREQWRLGGRPDQERRLFRFYQRLLEARPASDFWQDYVDAGFRSGQAEAALAFATAQRDDVQKPFVGRLRAQTARISALLALNRVEEAVAEMRQLFAWDPASEPLEDQHAYYAQTFRFAGDLCTLGHLTDHPSWIGDGVAAALAQQARVQALETRRLPGSRSQRRALASLSEALLEAKQYATLEPLLQDALVEAVHEQSAHGAIYNSGPLPELVSLARLYHAAGRPADVVLLAESAPWWGISDLADATYGGQGLDVALAASLLAVGRAPDAARIIRNHLLNHPADDAAYAILLEIGGDDRLPWLETLLARDRFEERPLIWKAELLRRHGKLEEAEAAVHDALAIDPTDGEQPAGDRCRAYVVLADILEARGKTDEASTARRVVQAVRLAEKGDAFASAGLIQRSLELYNEAAAAFADAYCVQWRLAERLYALGRLEDARPHYEAAFAHMPDQFGAVASFCFGCEGVFNHAYSRSAAERVLTHAAETNPTRPQIPYLLGLLRTAEGRYREAYENFKRATELDPDYLDAWDNLNQLGSTFLLPRADQDAAVIRILELDPLQRHAHVNLRETTTLGGVWKVLSEKQDLRLEPPKTLFVFAGSEAAQRTSETDPYWRRYGAHRDASVQPESPGDMLLNHEVIQSILPLMETTGAMHY